MAEDKFKGILNALTKIDLIRTKPKRILPLYGIRISAPMK